jgi:hypothetical protein
MSRDDVARRALLRDSEATLRQVKAVLRDFTTSGEPATEGDDRTRDADTGRASATRLVDADATLVSLARSDMSGHLTAALAEVQLLLMDVDSEALRESYEVIQRALRGLRTVLASLGHNP